MPFINDSKVKFNIDYKQVGNHFELSKDYVKSAGWRFKKITATRLAAVLGLNSHTSQFKLWCSMVNIFTEEMEPATQKVGNVIEKKVREFVNKQLVQKYGIDFKYSFYKPEEVNYDCWKGKDDVFGGIPDAEPYIDGKLAFDKGLPLLEIKTSSVDALKWTFDDKLQLKLKRNPDGSIMAKPDGLGAKRNEWFDENGEIKIPVEYKYQLALYMYLRNVNKGMLACCFVETKDYLNPESITVNASNTIAAAMNFDPKILEPELQKARDWYYKYVKAGISPEMNEEDLKWWEKQKALLLK